jgi:hypothetical protein
MNILLDAALFDLEKRLSSEELAELTDSLIYTEAPTQNQRKVSRGSFCNKELLGVLLSLHPKKHTFTVVGIFYFGVGRGPLPAFTSTWAV